MSSSTENAVESTGWNMFSDTPQGGLNGLRDETYMSSATKITSDESSSSETAQTNEGTTSSESEGSYNSAITGMEDYLEHIKGVNGGMSASKRIKEFRETFLNIDMQIIDNLKNLFFYLW